MRKEAMVDVCLKAMKYQDVGDFEGQMTLYADDCTFMMPHIKEPLRGSGQLRKDVKTWPKSITNAEWFVAEGNTLVAGWNWRAAEADETIPTLRGVSIFKFNDEGLVQDYEDFFDPGWINRHDN